VLAAGIAEELQGLWEEAAPPGSGQEAAAGPCPLSLPGLQAGGEAARVPPAPSGTNGPAAVPHRGAENNLCTYTMNASAAFS